MDAGNMLIEVAKETQDDQEFSEKLKYKIQVILMTARKCQVPPGHKTPQLTPVNIPSPHQVKPTGGNTVINQSS